MKPMAWLSAAVVLFRELSAQPMGCEGILELAARSERFVEFDTRDFDDTGITAVSKTLEVLGLRVESLGTRLRIEKGESQEQDLALARTEKLLRGSIPPSSKTRLDHFLDGIEDLVVERATPEQIAKMPFLFLRWDPRKVDGHHALRANTTLLFRDPTRHFYVVHIPSRQNFPGAKWQPAETEVIRISSDEPGSSKPSLRTFGQRGEKETKNAQSCLLCHVVRGGLLYSLTRQRTNSPVLAWGSSVIAGPGRSFFIESNALRASGAAASLSREEVIRLFNASIGEGL